MEKLPRQCPCSEPIKLEYKCHFNCGKCKRFLSTRSCEHNQCRCGGTYYAGVGQDPMGITCQCECGSTEK